MTLIRNKGARLSSAWFSRRVLIGVLIASLPGCASTTPLISYDLKPVEPAGALRPVSHPAGATLAVPVPAAALLIDSQRIIVRTGSELAYLKGAQWSARVPDLIQAKLIESFEKSRRPVVRVPGPDAKYTLETDIRRFEADVTRNIATVEIDARLVGTDGEIIAARNFVGTALSPGDDGPAVSAAIDNALGNVLRQIVVWAAGKA